MGDRIDELGGELKKGVGELTGDTRLAAEGEVQSGHARAKRKAKGALREAGGAVEERLGELTGDEAATAEGTAEKLRGRAERTV
jgi:uncharacterized protein YjbJ (UPF0337 family)